mmetsp:Transcript_93145/g.266094  ORF Transcript_93145/g.266094 Transcript_93145/m.266094 type:complete len:1207 (+) Transcript_93145:45-3665(+)
MSVPGVFVPARKHAEPLNAKGVLNVAHAGAKWKHRTFRANPGVAQSVDRSNRIAELGTLAGACEVLIKQIAATAPVLGGGVVIATLDSLAAACLEAVKLVTGELQGNSEPTAPETVRGMVKRDETRRGSMFEMGSNDLHHLHARVGHLGSVERQPSTIERILSNQAEAAVAAEHEQTPAEAFAEATASALEHAPELASVQAQEQATLKRTPKPAPKPSLSPLPKPSPSPALSPAPTPLSPAPTPAESAAVAATARPTPPTPTPAAAEKRPDGGAMGLTAGSTAMSTADGNDVSKSNPRGGGHHASAPKGHSPTGMAASIQKRNHLMRMQNMPSFLAREDQELGGPLGDGPPTHTSTDKATDKTTDKTTDKATDNSDILTIRHSSGIGLQPEGAKAITQETFKSPPPLKKMVTPGGIVRQARATKKILRNANLDIHITDADGGANVTQSDAGTMGSFTKTGSMKRMLDNLNEDFDDDNEAETIALLFKERATEVFGIMDNDLDGWVNMTQMELGIKLLLTEERAREAQRKIDRRMSGVALLENHWLGYTGLPVHSTEPEQKKEFSDAVQHAVSTIGVRTTKEDPDGHALYAMKSFLEIYEFMADKYESTREERDDEELDDFDESAYYQYQASSPWMRGRHKLGGSRYLFNPLHPIRAKWAGICNILLIFTVFMLPLTLGFSEGLPCELETIGLIIDLIFMADVIICCNTGYEDTDGMVIMDRQRAFNAYLQGWLIIDTLTAVPLDKAMDIIMTGDMSMGCDLGNEGSVDYESTDLSGTRISKAGKAMKTFKLVRLTRLAKILRIARLVRVVGPYVKQFVGDASDYETIFKLLSPIITVIFLAHYLSGVTFMLADLESFPDESWIYQLDLIGKPWEVQYMYGWLRSMFLLLGQPRDQYTSDCEVSQTIRIESALGLYGNSTVKESQYPTYWCQYEDWIDLLTMTCGALFYSILFGMMGNVILAFYTSRYKECQTVVQSYMAHREIDKDLRARVNTFFAEAYGSGRYYFEPENVLDVLPPALAQELARSSCSRIITLVPILNHAPRGFTRQLAGLMAANVATAGDLIVLEGDDAGVVHFMESGSVYVLSRHTVAREIRLSGRYLETMSLKAREGMMDELEGQVGLESDNLMAVLGAGCYFGEVSSLLGTKRSASCIARTTTVTMTLDSDHLNDALSMGYEDVKKFMYEVSKLLLSSQHSRPNSFIHVCI